MALKEQALGDLNYVRLSAAGKPSKPVVNLVHAPPVPPSMAMPMATTNQIKPNPRTRAKPPPPPTAPRRGGAAAEDDDDDSEVEMLSISSGDEDNSSKEIGVQQRARQRKPSGDDADRVGDGEEPRTWKQVDEAELARRVREMRETRAIPVTQTVDLQALAVARKAALINMKSLPRGVEVLDPLGLGVIDNKSLKLITDALDSSPGFSKSDALDPSIREKVIYSSPNFDSKVFLSHVHQETSAADLESAAITLRSDLKGRTQQKKQLVKENFDCFVSCKTTIDDIESKMRQIEEDPEGAGTARLHDATQKISEVANRAFQPLFERQVQAEKIRSVQGMLQRFRTLFNLPSAIRGSISKGEYDLAVREYRKAKSIVLPSHVGILKRVLEEVEKVMLEFRGTLYKSMEDPQLDLADLENTVRLLLELEPDSDPVWHYLNIQNRRVRGLLEKCTLDHEAHMEALHNAMRERIMSDARWRQLQHDSNKSLDVDSSVRDSFPEDYQAVDLIGEEVDVLRGRYICRLTAVLVHHVPAFWRLTLSVFSGKFAKISAGNVVLDSEANTKPGSTRSEDKTGDMKYTSHSLEEVAAMVHGTVSAYEAKVNRTFRDFGESNILQSYMSDAIKEIAKACQALEGKESAPTIAVRTLRSLHFEITKINIQRLCSWMRATTEDISKDEDWIPLSTLERNKSPYAISYLPLSFQEMTISAMNQIDAMVQNLRSEAAKSEDMLDELQGIQESVRLAFLNCFLDFAGYLERIGGELSQSRPNNENDLQNGYLNGLARELPGVHSGGSVDDSHKKLLIVLSNIGYCKVELSRGLYDKYKHIWMQEGEQDEQYNDTHDLIMSFSALEEKVLENYTFVKSNLIRTAASNYLLDSGFQWGGAPAVKGIRDATIELLHCLVAVHAEAEILKNILPQPDFTCQLFAALHCDEIDDIAQQMISFALILMKVLSGAKPLLEKTLGILVEGLIDTFLSLFNENKAKDFKSLDANGFYQLTLELEYFDTVLSTYFSSDAHEAFKSLQGLLLEKVCESASEPIDNPRQKTRGSEDTMADDRSQGPTVSPDDLLAMAHQYSSELLEGELERTRLNIACFMDSSLQPSPVPVSSKAAYSSNHKKQQAAGSPGFSQRRR